MTATSPHQSNRPLRFAVPVERREWPQLILAMALLFCAFTGYFSVRPVRETIGTLLGRERVEDLFVATWVLSILLVFLYASLVARVSRRVLLPCIYGAVAVLLASIAMVLRVDPQNALVGSAFYVLISVLNLFVISIFWSFMLECLSQSQSKRLFGIIAAGGTAGALAGPVLTDLFVGSIGISGILVVGATFFVAAIGLQVALATRHWSVDGAANEQVVRGIGTPFGSANPFSGMMLVLRSPYLAGIALFMLLLSSVTTFLYMEQLEVVARVFASAEERTRFFSRVDYTVQSLTIVIQLFATGRIATRFGLAALLTTVPLLMVGGFIALAATGTLAVLTVVMVIRRVGEYAFVRPGRELLYASVDTESKYKAKTFNDVPVYRGGDALAAQIQGVLREGGLTGSAIAVIGAGVAAVWAGCGWYLARSKR